MLLHDKKIEDLIKFIKPYLNDMIMDYRENITGDEADWFVKRIAHFLHKKTWVNEKHFFDTCRYVVENYTTYRKLNVAIFKTAFAKLFDK